MESIEIRRATARDGEMVRGLLTGAGLPLAGITPGLEHFLVAHRDGVIVGAIGLELYPPLALLRSAVVSTAERGKGTGTALVRSIEDLAEFAGIQQLILLTTTAETFFAGQGYHRMDRDALSGPITHSVEFAGACPASAVCMAKHLR
jgi:amino-acid N-acetyltransferase